MCVLPSSLRLDIFTLLAFLLMFSRQPQRRKGQKADAGTDRAHVVRPRGAQETWIPIVSRGDNWHRRSRLERGPATTAMVEDEFEHTVSVGSAERGAVLAGASWDGTKRSADVRVEHRELYLEIVQSRVG